MTKYSKILFIFIIFLTLGCAPKKINNERIMEQPKGVQLVLMNVDKKYEQQFKDSFKFVIEEHSKIINASSSAVDIKTGETLFKIKRTDLANAELIYDAKSNTANFRYYYTPKQEDVKLYPQAYPPQYHFELFRYYDIYFALRNYFYDCLSELQRGGAAVQFPQIYVTFYVNDDKYIRLSHKKDNAMFPGVFYNFSVDVKIPNKQQVTYSRDTQEGYVMGFMLPSKTISGYTDDPLLQFFNINYPEK